MQHEIKKFIYVGMVSNLINFFFFYITYELIKSLLFSSFFGYSLGLLFSYLGGRFWVFNKSNEKSLKRFFIFVIVYLVGGLGMSLIISFCSNSLYFDYRISWLFGTSFAATNNFIGQKYLVFRAN